MKLPDTTTRAIWLAKWRDRLTLREIAERHGVTVGVVARIVYSRRSDHLWRELWREQPQEVPS